MKSLFSIALGVFLLGACFRVYTCPVGDGTFGMVDIDAQGRYHIGGRLADPTVFYDPMTAPNLVLRGPGGISEAAFHQINQEVMMPYFQIAADNGATLVLNHNWPNATVNAFAGQQGNVWTIYMYGGLARRQEITEDGYALVVCHELGHHFGGFPFYLPGGLAWAAAEGQADYFATNVCLKNYFRSSEAQLALNISAIDQLGTLSSHSADVVKEKCGLVSIYPTNRTFKENFGLCVRLALATKSFADLLANLVQDPLPEFSTPDPLPAAQTYHYHPNAQCRLDTGFSGALCSVDSAKQIRWSAIPGKDFQFQLMGHPAKPLMNSEKLRQEREGGFFSCNRNARDAEVFDLIRFLGWGIPDLGEPWGYRPSCWFRNNPNSFGPYIY